MVGTSRFYVIRHAGVAERKETHYFYFGIRHQTERKRAPDLENFGFCPSSGQKSYFFCNRGDFPRDRNSFIIIFGQLSSI